MQFPITIGLHRSRFLDCLLMLTAVVAALAILAFPGAPSVRAMLLLLVVLLTLRTWRSLTPTIKEIRLERSGDISIARVGETDFIQAVPMPGATIHPWLSIIQFSVADGRPATVIATVNRKNRENLKCLRVFMRWQAKFSEPSDDA